MNKSFHLTQKTMRVCLYDAVSAERFSKTSMKLGEDKIIKNKFPKYITLKRYVQLWI